MKDYTGLRSGMMTALRFERVAGTKRYWLFRCDCGREKVGRIDAAVSQILKSCGCLKPGDSDSRLNHTWAAMKARCKNPSAASYRYYGARGISFDPAWEKFEAFKADMGKSYAEHVATHGEKETLLDRIDSNQGYSAANCRWATRTQQNRNKGNNVIFSFEGRSQCLSAWAEEFGFDYFTLRNRVDRLGWTIERALTTPVMKQYSHPVKSL